MEKKKKQRKKNGNMSFNTIRIRSRLVKYDPNIRRFNKSASKPNRSICLYSTDEANDFLHVLHETARKFVRHGNLSIYHCIDADDSFMKFNTCAVSVWFVLDSIDA